MTLRSRLARGRVQWQNLAEKQLPSPQANQRMLQSLAGKAASFSGRQASYGCSFGGPSVASKQLDNGAGPAANALRRGGDGILQPLASRTS